ncbi:MAG: MFS transporter [Promethearchaeia archaeon]
MKVIVKVLLFLLLAGLIFLKSSFVYIVITSFPKLQKSYNLSNTQLGIILSIYYLISGLIIFIWLYFFERYSKFKILNLNMFFWIIGCILLSFSQNYYNFIIFIIIIAIGIEASSIIILLIFFEITPNKNQGKLLSFFIAIQGFGSIFGVFITGYLEDILSLSWRCLFLFLGIFSLIWFLLTSIFIYKNNILKNIFLDPLVEFGYILNFRMIIKILKKKSNLGLIILLIYSIPIVFFLNLWIQKYFQEFHNLTQMEASISYIFLTGGEFLGMVVGGFLFDKYYSIYHYKKYYITIFALLIAIPLFFIGFYISWKKTYYNSTLNLIDLGLDLLNFAFNNSNVFLSYTSLFLGFFFFAMLYPFILIVIKDCNNIKEVGVMLGIKNLIEILGQAISPFIGGLIADIFSIQVVMLVVPFFLIISLLNIILLKKYIEKDFFFNYHNIKEEDKIP